MHARTIRPISNLSAHPYSTNFGLKIFNMKCHPYVCVDVDLLRRFAGQPDELPRVQGSNHHLAGFLDGPERLGRARVVPVLNRLDLTENLLRDSGRLKINLKCFLVFFNRSYLSFHSNSTSERFS